MLDSGHLFPARVSSVASLPAGTTRGKNMGEKGRLRRLRRLRRWNASLRPRERSERGLGRACSSGARRTFGRASVKLTPPL